MATTSRWVIVRVRGLVVRVELRPTLRIRMVYVAVMVVHQVVVSVIVQLLRSLMFKLWHLHVALLEAVGAQLII